LLLLALGVFVFTFSNDSAKIPPASETKPAKLSERRSHYTRRRVIYTEVPPYIDVISSNFSFTTLPVIDTVSMGHKQSEAGRLTLQAQRESWVTAMPGSRFFFAATESVCFPGCLSQNVTSEERDQICNTDTPAPSSDRPTFWSHHMLQSFAKQSSGWWCAQKRAAWALRDMMHLYNSPEMNYSYPDWMLIVDDDTWFNPSLLPKTLSHMKINIPIAIAPSIIISDNLDEPSLHYGGVGLAVNRVLLKAMNRPIYCNLPQTNIHCRRLEKAGLLSQFQDGMSLIDFMVELLSRRVSCLVRVILSVGNAFARYASNLVVPLSYSALRLVARTPDMAGWL
jgi:hypothetical protein